MSDLIPFELGYTLDPDICVFDKMSGLARLWAKDFFGYKHPK